MYMSSLAVAIGTLNAAKILHLKMLRNILRNPMVFFDTTPVGRILSRFSKDVDVCDSTLPSNLRTWPLFAFRVRRDSLLISLNYVLLLDLEIVQILLVKALIFIAWLKENEKQIVYIKALEISHFMLAKFNTNFKRARNHHLRRFVKKRKIGSLEFEVFCHKLMLVHFSY